MTASYATEHSGALADVRAAGTDVTFTLVTSTYAESTDVETAPVTTTVTGAAIATKNAISYRGGSNVTQGSKTLLFVPDTYGDRPDLNATVEWEGATWTVVDVQPLSPSGTDILSRVVLA